MALRIHSRVQMSTVNGPGRRAVVWFQGCQGMSCANDCWNKESHDPAGGEEISTTDLILWLDNLVDAGYIDGVTFSGGEPMQQAVGMIEVINTVKMLNPQLSLGMFTGYSLKELRDGKYNPADNSSTQIKMGQWAYLETTLDFAVVGRYVKAHPSDEPLTTSSNQSIQLFTTRHKLSDFQQQLVEITIDQSGLTNETGFPTKGSIIL